MQELRENKKYFAKFYCNRWNDDGVSLLYLSYDNEGIAYQNIMAVFSFIEEYDFSKDIIIWLPDKEKCASRTETRLYFLCIFISKYHCLIRFPPCLHGIQNGTHGLSQLA